jgi:N-acetylmuramoyl-L-alanine amidase
MATRRVPSKTSLKRLHRRPGHSCLFLLLAALVLPLTYCGVRRLKPVPVGFDPGPLPKNSLKGVTVVIDPGHGGADPGAVERNLSEAQLTYRTAATLARVLREAGATTHFTIRSAALTEQGSLRSPRDAAPEVAPNRPLRSGREHPEDLYARGDLAARYWDRGARPICFVSVHYDVSGYLLRPGGHIIWDRRRGQTPPKLARILSRKFGETGLCGALPPRPVPRGLGMLAPGRNPVPESVLVECATLTNPDDFRAAQDPRWRQALCRVIAHSIKETLKP